MTRSLAPMATGLMLAALLPLSAAAEPLRGVAPAGVSLYPAQYQPAASATFRLPPGVPNLPVSWEGVPLDPAMSPEAWAPMETSPTIRGEFEPGRWRITAHVPGEVTFSAIVTLAPGQMADITLPVTAEPEPQTGFDAGSACQTAVCPVAVDGLAVALRQGWWMEPPAWTSATVGAHPLDFPRVDFHGPGGASLHLNPHQWLMANGPCQETAAGQLCQWLDASQATAEAADAMAPTLRLIDRAPPRK